jgi:hypothetical protein
MEELVEEHGTLYRWVWQYESTMEEEGEACFVSTYVENVRKACKQEDGCALPAGWKWTLQLNMRKKEGKEDDWWDWASIKKSNRVGGNLGLFAARFFPKGSMIGYYSSPVAWRCPDAGTMEPTDELLTSEGIIASAYSISILNKDCTWQNVDPKPVGRLPGHVLYLGMHYMNSACRSFVADSPEFESAKRNQNCLIYNDGIVRATKKIHPGTELLTGYNHDEHYAARKTKVCDRQDDMAGKGQTSNGKKRKSMA